MNIRTNCSAKIFLLLLAVIGTFAGCTTGWHHNYQQSVPELPFEGTSKIVVMVSDNRNLPSESVGKVEALYGDPWFVRTESGSSFVEELGTAVCTGFTERGFICSVEIIQEGDPKQNVLRIIQEQYPDRIVHFVVNQWFTDVYSQTDVAYDLGVEALNQRGRLIAAVTFAGIETLDMETYVNPAENASIVAPRFLSTLLSRVFGHPDISSAFKNIVIEQPKTGDYIRGEVGRTHILRQHISEERRKGYRR